MIRIDDSTKRCWPMLIIIQKFPCCLEDAGLFERVGQDGFLHRREHQLDFVSVGRLSKVRIYAKFAFILLGEFP